MDIVSNDTIKLQLLTLYGNHYQYIKNLQNQYDKTHGERISSRLHNNNIDMWERLSDEDKHKIISDKQLYTSMKSEAKYSLRKYLSELQILSPTLTELIENINQEVVRLREK